MKCGYLLYKQLLNQLYIKIETGLCITLYCIICSEGKARIYNIQLYIEHHYSQTLNTDHIVLMKAINK